MIEDSLVDSEQFNKDQPKCEEKEILNLDLFDECEPNQLFQINNESDKSASPDYKLIEDHELNYAKDGNNDDDNNASDRDEEPDYKLIEDHEFNYAKNGDDDDYNESDEDSSPDHKLIEDHELNDDEDGNNDNDNNASDKDSSPDFKLIKDHDAKDGNNIVLEAFPDLQKHVQINDNNGPPPCFKCD